MMKNDELKNSIRFLGIGQAGANVTQMLEKKGYKTYYINLAKQDLDLISSPNKYHIPNGEGASKNRKKAKKVLSESIEEVLGVIDEQISEKYIFVVYSLGGGTGAGLGTFLSSVIAENPDKIVCLVVILPSMNESLQARINAYEALTEIVEAKNSLGSIFILDNNQREDKLSINRSFANLFDSFINVANYSSIRGVIDIAEQKTLLETSGVAAIHRITQGGKDELVSSINNGIYPKLEGNKKVKYIGLSQSDSKEVISVDELTDIVGEGIDTFTGYGNTEETVLYLAGLSMPKTYIENLQNSIKAEQERVKKILEDDDLKMDKNINFISASNNVKEKQDDKPQMSMRDRLLAGINK